MGDDPRRNIELFVEAFRDSANSSADLADMLEAFLENLTHKDGLITALYDVRDEIYGLREDLRALAKSGGIGALLSVLRR